MSVLELLAFLPADAELDPMRYLGYYLAVVLVVGGGMLAYTAFLMIRLKVLQTDATPASDGATSPQPEQV